MGVYAEMILFRRYFMHATKPGPLLIEEYLSICPSLLHSSEDCLPLENVVIRVRTVDVAAESMRVYRAK